MADMHPSAAAVDVSPRPGIRTPDQRLRVFVSSTLQELVAERATAREAISHLRLTPVLFELGARPHPPKDLYRAYLAQSDIFLGIYWQRYGWVAPGMDVSGLEDEYRLAGSRPKLIYVKFPAPEREQGLKALLDRIKADDNAAYKPFETTDELHDLVENDLALLLTERFDQVRAADAPSSARAVLVPEIRRPALPFVRTPLVDRSTEANTARTLLSRDDVGLVTLTGPGGAGKTRLAHAIAASLGDAFADGTVFIPLASLAEPSLVAATIASTLGLRESPDRPVAETLTEALRDRRMLLVLDNFEQVVKAAPFVGQLLEACPNVKCLVTSRRKLRVRGEKEIPVSPLEVPGELTTSADSLAQIPSVDLFVQRAQEVKPDFALTEQTARLVAEICRRLDGVPLAIELAAARIKVLPPKTMLARLDRALPLLTSGAQDLPARQQTMQCAIAWSYDLLSEEAKTLFRRLSVFSGGCTLEAIDAVCNRDADLGADPLEVLELLIDVSLVREGETPEGDARYSMLGTIREYALDRLAESGERDALQRFHAEYVLQFVEDAEPHFTSAERWDYLARLDVERDNIRAALEWCKATGDRTMWLRLVGALGWFWFLRGHLREGHTWVQAALTGSPPQVEALVRAKALHWLAGLAFARGDFKDARQPAEESVAMFSEAGDLRELGFAEIILGLVQFGSGDSNGARTTIEQAQGALRRVDGEQWGVAFALYSLGDVTLAAGDSAGAHRAYEESLAIFDELHDRWGRAVLLHALGRVSEAQQDNVAAHSLYDASGALFREMGDRWDLARVLASMQSLALQAGDYEQSKLLCKESLALSRDLGNSHGMLRSLEGLAAVAATQGQPDAAARILGAVDALSRASGRPTSEQNSTELRSQLGEQTFNAEWAAGKVMTLEEVAAYASALPAAG